MTSSLEKRVLRISVAKTKETGVDVSSYRKIKQREILELLPLIGK
jgi:hypothetical protein